MSKPAESGHVVVTRCYPSGVVSSISKWSWDGKQIKQCEEFSESGQRLLQITFGDSGIEHIMQWYATGELRSLSTGYYGLSKFYYRNGTLASDIMWFDDGRTCERKRFYSNGIQAVGCYGQKNKPYERKQWNREGVITLHQVSSTDFSGSLTPIEWNEEEEEAERLQWCDLGVDQWELDRKAAETRICSSGTVEYVDSESSKEK